MACARDRRPDRILPGNISSNDLSIMTHALQCRRWTPRQNPDATAVPPECMRGMQARRSRAPNDENEVVSHGCTVHAIITTYGGSTPFTSGTQVQHRLRVLPGRRPYVGDLRLRWRATSCTRLRRRSTAVRSSATHGFASRRAWSGMNGNRYARSCSFERDTKVDRTDCRHCRRASMCLRQVRQPVARQSCISVRFPGHDPVH